MNTYVTPVPAQKVVLGDPQEFVRVHWAVEVLTGERWAVEVLPGEH